MSKPAAGMRSAPFEAEVCKRCPDLQVPGPRGESNCFVGGYQIG